MAAFNTSDDSFLVVKSLCNLITPLLGNTSNLKCLREEEKAVFTNCAAHTLQNLDVMHPVGNLINTAVQAHHLAFGCGTKTLLVMVGLWMKEAEILIDKGIPLGAFIEGMQEALEIVCKMVIDIGYTIQLEKEQTQKGTEGLELGEELTVVDDEIGFIEVEFAQEGNELLNKSNDLGNKVNEIEQFEMSFNKDQHKGVDCGDMKASDKNHGKFTVEMKEESGLSNKLDEEIGWFFDDGKVPGLPSLDKVVCEQMDSVFSDFQNMAFPMNFLKEEESPLLSSIGFTKLEKSHHQNDDFSSIQEGNDSKDEFDACFEENNVAMKSSTEKAAPSCNSTEESFEDEFDACFEDVEHYESSKEVIQIESEVNQSSSLTEPKPPAIELAGNNCDDMKSLEEKLKQIFEAKSQSKVLKTVHQSRHFKSNEEGTLTEQLSFEDKEVDESLEDEDRNSHESLEKKLADIMSKKKKHSASHIMNKSRHFKTIETTVRSLNEEISSECNKTKEERTKGEELETKLQEILAKKATTKVDKSRVLSSSKHFNTFESTAAVVSTPLINTSINFQIENADLQTSEIPIPFEESAIQNLSAKCNHGNEENDTQDDKMEKKIFQEMKSNLQSVTQSKVRIVTKDPSESNTVTDLKSLCQGLSHGADEEMQFVHDILQKHKMVNEEKGEYHRLMHTSQVHTICVPNAAARRSCVLEGILAELTSDQMMMLSSCEKQQRNCLLINGDLKPNFTHIGFKQSVKSKVISNSIETKSKPQKWMEKCMETIQELAVTAILVNGVVDPDLLDICTSQNIVICSNTPYKILQALGETTKACIAVYLRECTLENVASGLIFEPWNTDWSDTFHPSTNYAAIKLQGICLHTVIFCHPCDNVVRLKEEKFLHCLNRVLNSLKSQIVLPGGGVTEEHCYRHLMELAEKKQRSQSHDNEDNDTHRSAVFQSIAQGFLNYAHLLSANTNACQPISLANNDTSISFQDIDLNADEFENPCYDDYISKVEAWKSAAHLLMQVLLADIQIVTGLADEAKNGITKGGNFIGII